MKSPSRSRALLALILIVPAPSVGVIAAMVLWPGAAGGAVFMLCKVWMALLPVVWLRFVERGRLSLSPIKRGGLGVGVMLGLAFAALIAGGFLFLGDRLIAPADIDLMREAAVHNRLAEKTIYILGCLYWITVNSLIEEYVYRWFITRKFEELLGAGGDVASGATHKSSVRLTPRAWLAVFASAAAFTIHHVLAMRAQGLGWPVTLLANVGVFLGGAIWSWLYERYQSIWPGYVSHAIVDMPIFVIGWMLIFATNQ